mmetsp:Transcript_29084/g.73786  ORF Transcript_29084/g.73786 Transcript_29084/m.73786 type:complete len:231 (+) Transcript_29084:61-753(+)
MVARCLRCHKMYAEEGGGGCYYHPGTHRGDSHYGRTGLMCGWSCCKELAEDARGCRLAAQHIPCEATAVAMRLFPKVAQDEGGASDGLRRRSGEAKEPPPVVVEGEPVELLTHTVRLGESIASIALRYGMRREQLVACNRLLTPQVAPGQRLRVTPPPKEREGPDLATRLRTFQRRTGSDSIEEARYYLDAASGDVAAAVKAYEADGAGCAPVGAQAAQDVRNDEGCAIA